MTAKSYSRLKRVARSRFRAFRPSANLPLGGGVPDAPVVAPPAPPSADVRVTRAADVRVTRSGDRRVTR